MRFFFMIAVVATAFLFVSSANASDWKRAESKHFVVYSTLGEKALREELEDLERIDRAIRKVRGQKDRDFGDGNRVTIFMLDRADTIQELYGQPGNFSGFYTYRPQGPVAVIPRTTNDRYNHKRETFVHEYAHHLMFQDLKQSVPKWLIEGFAEFFSTARIGRGGKVEIGRPGLGMANVLNHQKITPLEELFDQREGYSKREMDNFYATSWLLTHYALFNQERLDQTQEYLRLMNDGVPSREAAPLAYGDLDTLTKDLKAYLAGKISYIAIEDDLPDAPDITVVDLDEGDGAAVEAYLTLWLGRDEPSLVDDLRGLASKHPGSGLVMTALAMAEISNDNLTQGSEAASAAIDLLPDKVEPKILKARALMRIAEKRDDDEARALYLEARKLVAMANRQDPEDPEPLLHFYFLSRLIDGRPSTNSISGLYYAAAIAPQDIGIRLKAAAALIEIEKYDEATTLLQGLLNDPHNASARAQASIMMGLIEKARGAVSTTASADL